jgi:protein-disulfide isomerase
MTTEKKFIIAIGVITLALIIAASFIFGKQSPQQAQNSTDKVDEAQLLKDAKDVLGDPNAPVRIVEFGDFQCPACGAAYPIVKSVVAKNSSKVYFVFRNFPLSAHPNGQISAKAAEAAALQGKFWQMHDILYEKQNEWATSQTPKDLFDQYAKSISLDLDKFNSDINNVTGKVNSDYTLGGNVGVNSTPTFFINGQKYPGVIQESQFQQIIDSLAPNQSESTPSSTKISE